MRLWDAGNTAGDSSFRFGRFRPTPEPAGEAAGPLPPLCRLRTKGPIRRSLPTISTMRQKEPWKKELMISPETRVQIRRYFYAEHWKIGTIARELNVHPDAVRNAIESDRFNRTEPMRASITDPYMEFVRQTLDRHPRLRATRIHQMIRDRGYNGSIVQLRRAVARLRPTAREPFLKLQAFPAEQAQVDWAHFGHVAVGRRPSHTVLLRGHALLVAGAVSGVLLRPDDGELPARACPCL